MQQNQPSSRIVALIPRDLKRAASAKAAFQGKSFKQVLIELLSEWVEASDNINEPEEETQELALTT